MPVHTEISTTKCSLSGQSQKGYGGLSRNSTLGSKVCVNLARKLCGISANIYNGRQLQFFWTLLLGPLGCLLWSTILTPRKWGGTRGVGVKLVQQTVLSLRLRPQSTPSPFAAQVITEFCAGEPADRGHLHPLLQLLGGGGRLHRGQAGRAGEGRGLGGQGQGRPLRPGPRTGGDRVHAAQFTLFKVSFF